MGWSQLIARWSLVLACAAACGDVEESVSTSATIGDAETGTGNIDATTGPGDDDVDADSASLDGETTQASASAEDASTDPGDTTPDPTTGIGDADSGDASTTSTTAFDPTTDDSAGVTTEPASACDPEGDDTACDTCVKSSCCDTVEICAANVDCWCVATCVGNGGNAFDCGDTCGVAAAPPGSFELFGCAGLVCGLACPQL